MYLYNMLVLLALIVANGGRYGWAYEWGSWALCLNLIPLVFSFITQRGSFYRRGPFFWVVAVLGPWAVFAMLFGASLFNPSFATIENNLFSPLQVLDYNATWPTTPNPERSRLFLQFLIGLILMVLNLITWPSHRSEIRLSLRIVFVFGVAWAAFGSLMKVSGNDRFLGYIELREPIAFATFFYKNHWAYFAVLCMGMGMAIFHRTRRREKTSGHFPERSVGLMLMILLVFLTIPLAYARGALLVAVPLLMVFGITILRVYFRWRFRAQTLWIFGGLLLLGCIGFWAVEPWLERAITKSHNEINAYIQHGMGSSERLLLYRDAWTVFQEKPIWGWGIGSFIHIHPIYAGPEFYVDGATKPVAFEFPHNDYLQCLAEMGVVGSLLFFGPFFSLGLGLWRRMSWNSDFVKWPMGAAIAIAVTSVFDMTLTAPAIAMAMLYTGVSAARYGLSIEAERV